MINLFNLQIYLKICCVPLNGRPGAFLPQIWGKKIQQNKWEIFARLYINKPQSTNNYIGLQKHINCSPLYWSTKTKRARLLPIITANIWASPDLSITLVMENILTHVQCFIKLKGKLCWESFSRNPALVNRHWEYVSENAAKTMLCVASPVTCLGHTAKLCFLCS